MKLAFLFAGSSFHYEFIDIPNYEPPWTAIQEGRSCETFFDQNNIDIRVLITTPLLKQFWKEKYLLPLKNDSRYIYIFHHAEAETRLSKRDILSWNNSYMAADLESLKHVFPPERMFTPSAMAISPREPTTGTVRRKESPYNFYYCGGEMPVAILQGAIMRNRDIRELEAIFEAGKDKFHIKVLTRNPPISSLVFPDKGKVEWFRRLNMTSFHEMFQTASFIIAGMNPQFKPDYFSGHPSSNIALSIHFGLPIIGHEAITKEYLAIKNHRSLLSGGYWHDGNNASIAAVTRAAIHDWYKSCGKVIK